MRFNTDKPFHENGFFEEVENPVPTCSQPDFENEGSNKKKRKRVADLFTDVGKCMMFGGKLLNVTKVNQSKKLGSKSNKQRLLEAFKSMEAVGLGSRENDSDFKFRDDLEQFLKTSPDAVQYVLQQGLSIQMLIESVNKESNVRSNINEPPSSQPPSMQPPSTQPTMNTAGLTSTVPIPTFASQSDTQPHTMNTCDKLE